MNFTSAQNLTINIESNCVVSAGAGSGKTGVLSQRFSRLVREKKAHCNEILTLTFTRKATSEMRERIYGLLVENADPSELDLFPDACISTVDGLCASIVRNDSRRYGISSDFTVMDIDEFNKKMSDIAYCFISENLDSPLVRRILEHVSPSDFAKMLAYTVSNNINIASDIDFSLEAIRYEKKSACVIRQSFEKIKEHAQMYVDRLSNDVKLKSNVAMLSAFIDGSTGADKIVFDRSLGTGTENKEIAKELKNSIREECVKYISLEKSHDSVFIKSFYDFVKQFSEKASDFKRSNSVLVFPDIMALALDILVNNKAVRTKYKNLYKYVMIDEFQDNNDDYRKLIYLLSEKYDILSDGIPLPQDIQEGKLFLVGDSKQSIYRFRGADVSVFKRMENEIKLSGGRLIELDTNFRSSPKLVEAFNSIFSRVMANSSENFEADFSRLESNPANSIDSKIIFNNFIHSHRIDKSVYPFEPASAVMSEAMSIADMINRMCTGDDFLIKGNVRPVYSDIAILLRQAGNQGEYEKALRLKGIPYIIDRPRSLTCEALVNDFYNALQLCIYPYDMVSKTAYDHSPLAPYDLEGLEKTIAEGSVAGSLSYIWYDMNYRNFIISDPVNQVYAEHYLWLYSLGVWFDENNKSIIEFLDYLRPMLGKSEKIRDVDFIPSKTDGVKIMTIHASKGLEFPIVIVAGMESGSSTLRSGFSSTVKNGDFYLPCTADSNGSLKCLCDILDPAYEARLENAETKRILYVAATRAESHLVFSASPSTAKLDDSDEKHILSPVRILLDACRFDNENRCFPDPCDSFFTPVGFDLVPVESTFLKHGSVTGKINEMNNWYNAKPDCFDYGRKHTSVTSLTACETESAGEKLCEIRSDYLIRENNLQTEFGSLVHAYIESSVKGIKKPRYVNAHLSENQIKMIESDADLLASEFLDSDLCRSMLNMEIHSEEKFTVYRDGMIVEGTIDLFAVSPDTVILVDFKTDLYKNPVVHQAQLDYYADALASLYPNRKIIKELVYLRRSEQA